jgi:hypothetical protein
MISYIIKVVGIVRISVYSISAYPLLRVSWLDFFFQYSAVLDVFVFAAAEALCFMVGHHIY